MAKRRISGAQLSEKEQHIAAVNDVATVINNAGSKYTNKDMASSLFGMESLNDVQFRDLDTTITELVRDLRGTSLTTDLLKTHSPEQITHALESAAYTIIAGGNPGGFYANAGRQTTAPEGFGALVMPMDGSVTMAMESFDPISAQKYLAATAVANAQAAISGGFEETFFPQQLVPAGQNGVDVQITIPKVFSTTARAGDGSTPFKLVKTSLVEAILTPDILESEATTVIPYAVDATNPPALVAAADIPSVNRTIDGIAVPTRPIKFGSEVDIIKLSNFPGLISVGVFDETDSLDPVMNLGEVYYKLVITTGGNTQTPTVTTAYLKADISGQIGAQLTQVQAGQGQAYQTTCTAAMYLNKELVSLNGATSAEVVAALEGVLGLAANTEFTLVVNTHLSATANIEYATFVANANNTSIVSYFDATGAAKALDPLTATGVSVAVTPMGFIPQVRRTNSNLRQNGTIIDCNTLVTYRFPVNLQAPLISQAPINATNNVTLEGLGYAAKIRNNGRAVKALENLENILLASNGIPAQSPMMGAEFVVPTYIVKTIDVQQMVSSMNSADNLPNLRGQLLSALTNMVNTALVQSKYLAALEMTTGNIDAFEIIVVTSPDIAPHIWESGDVRSFGDNRKYIITKSNNTFFAGKIYFSFRRSGRSDEIHPLDFGRMLVTPGITYDVQINRNGRTVNEIHTVPRTNSYVTLPILGRLNVLNLESIFVSQ